MTPAEYGAYVAILVQQLSFSTAFEVTRIEEFAGGRQPGKYEVDIAVRVRVGVALDFLFIVECKDRPVVQRVAQTRDAIAAHKAAIASPVGFYC